TFGELTAPLNHHRHEYRDDVNTLRIELARADMELLPASQAEMQNRANLALIGNEIINFSGVTQTGDTTYELTGLLRGRKHTAATSHSAGERFILLDDQILFVPAEQFDLNRTLTFRATSYGAEPSTSGWQSLTLTGIKEPAPAYLKAHRQGNELILSWTGTGRRGGGANVSLSAGFKHYRIT
ncbi:GTA baseplate fiber-binding domain-containing protein, partial [Ventosimonas gracilis]|uniref:GTA baseplate fiber-binding domain-containing protein n=1 Tax=Ventosimonas gracilis TaxID=1680762 RepID=UPI00195D6101